MDYVDGFIAAVPKEHREKFIEHAQVCAKVFKEYGALSVVDCWEDDVPEGKLTSMPMAVQKKSDEDIVFSWITWPSKQIRDQGMEQAIKDPRMSEETNPMPFDGKRLIFGGFKVLHHL